MNDVLQLICVAAIGIEFVMLLLSTIFITVSVKNTLVYGLVSCLFLLGFSAVGLSGVLAAFDVKFDFLGKEYYSVFADMLIWAIDIFGILISLYSAIAGFKKKAKASKEKVAEKVVADDYAAKEEIIKPVIENVFRGLETENDIEAFICGDERDDCRNDVEEKINTLKKIEKLFK